VSSQEWLLPEPTEIKAKSENRSAALEIECNLGKVEIAKTFQFIALEKRSKRPDNFSLI
jgi:hypothetical protein